MQVKLITVHLDGKLVSCGTEGLLTLRRAPGNCHFNFAQDLNLTEKPCYNYVNANNIHTSSLNEDQLYYSMPQPSMSLGDSVYKDSHELPVVKLSPPKGSGDAELETSSFSHLYPVINVRDVGDDEFRSMIRNSALLGVSPHTGSAVVGDEEYESPMMPQGFVFQLMILSTWGDPYYVGLNGLEMYDEDGHKLRLNENSKLLSYFEL